MHCYTMCMFHSSDAMLLVSTPPYPSPPDDPSPPQSHPSNVQDTAFSWHDLLLKNNTDLLNNLGNFINR